MGRSDYRERRRRMKKNNIQPDLDGLKEWLLSAFDDVNFERADLLVRDWFHCSAAPGCDWTREAELERWIAAAKDYPIAWAGCRRLLKELDRGDVPPALIRWAIDVAAERIKEPKLKHGQHATDNVLRDLKIGQAVKVCRTAGLTLDDACALVEEVVKAPQAEQIRDIYQEYCKTGDFWSEFKQP